MSRILPLLTEEERDREGAVGSWNNSSRRLRSANRNRNRRNNRNNNRGFRVVRAVGGQSLIQA